MSFANDILQYANKINATLPEACRGIKISLFSGIIDDTRVDTGRLRGNWQTSTGEPVYSQIERFDGEGKANEGSAVNEVLANVTAYGVDYLTNNLPYAEVWEDRDKMVAKNITKINRNIKEAIQNVNS